MEELLKQWTEVCKQCTHSYTTKDNPEKIKCRCRKKCKFDDKGLKSKK